MNTEADVFDWYENRNNKIYTEWLAGSPFRDLAERWRLSDSRVRHIIAEMMDAEKREAREVTR